MILGTCQSVGCTVDGKPPHDVIDGVNSGDYNVPDVRSFVVILNNDPVYDNILLAEVSVSLESGVRSFVGILQCEER